MKARFEATPLGQHLKYRREELIHEAEGIVETLQQWHSEKKKLALIEELAKVTARLYAVQKTISDTHRK